MSWVHRNKTSLTCTVLILKHHFWCPSQHLKPNRPKRFERLHQRGWFGVLCASRGDPFLTSRLRRKIGKCSDGDNGRFVGVVVFFSFSGARNNFDGNKWKCFLSDFIRSRWIFDNLLKEIETYYGTNELIDLFDIVDDGRVKPFHE